MKTTILKNIVVTVTLALAAVATWAVTESKAPAIHADTGLSRSA